MAEVHGARGIATFADTGVVMNVRKWMLSIEPDIEDVTKLKGVVGTPFVGIVYHDFRGLHGKWSGTVEFAIDDTTTPSLANILKATAATFTLMDGAGHQYVGAAFVRRWRPDNDRFATTTATAEFQGSGVLAIT